MNHNMPIEKGRYLDIEHNHRLCHLCNLLGDEYHYLFECTHFSADRRKNIQRYYFTHPNTYKLQELMNNKDISILTKLAIFCKIRPCQIGILLSVRVRVGFRDPNPIKKQMCL